MRTKRLSAALLLIVALGFVALGVVKMRSTGADVSPQIADPPESVFGPHSYTLPPDLEVQPPADDSPPAFSREEMIAEVQAAHGNNGRLASVDLVDIRRSSLVLPRLTGRYWLVIWTDVLISSLGGEAPLPGSPCDRRPNQRPASCFPESVPMTTFALYDAETGAPVMGGSAP